MMTDQEGTMKHLTRNEFATPKVVDRAAFQTELDALRLREKAYTKEGDAVAAARRRLPMVEVDGATPLIGERGAVTLLDVFEGRRMGIDGKAKPDEKAFKIVFTAVMHNIASKCRRN
jgi:hypothetical protein